MNIAFNEKIKFFFVSLFGIVIDFAAVNFFFLLFKVNFMYSCVLAFFVASLVNFFFHYYWTFVSRSLSSRKLVYYFNFLLSIVVGLITRMSVIYVLILLFTGESTRSLVFEGIYVLGVITSFLVNFLISDKFVFKPNIVSTSAIKSR
ncbi:MAG: hypothetical protein COZ46_01570 [Verrucomicrobia bacterium CG_4_10_14_3_um_filter_43_23]|nr:MAG: hypothetical protein AUJ82_01590 [Verrucomicrobia bacterium CG1_02_43_26]PIP59589.1 MAG: hypothetical protein COX01_03175 [Verrucomicrobia bacterium CG22_combo_CG10-13_8_21_14_all_43_17]PIX58888.1 MAG: hypothetical protein COZ46_01570 [Verrucomicrobia bacterium CG_4_10_14_3_um_filter_43_23]PIY61664.1 MAG: hypothetical protein COY94_04155 [Verrucomicrobia bacterium CG_4_10_14_0_8_um_filter_43_34]PJA44548.1 MAG: hypothetical protein CO175_02225 [Verrucomicrobia bacterium CG_4_9_14_3_um_fi